MHGRASVRAVRHKDKEARSGRTPADDPDDLGKALRLPPSPAFGFTAALAYGATSLALVFLNKAVLMHYKYSLTILTLQMAVSAGLIELGRSFKMLTVPPFQLSTARSLLMLSFFYNANVAFSLASLQGINIPMYIALKRLTPMAVLITGFFTGKKRPSVQVVLSVVTTVVGCLIAALGDFSLDIWGYGLALTSVLCQTAYLVIVEKSGAEEGLSSAELMLYNAVLSLPVLTCIVVLSGEARASLPLLVQKCSESMVFSAAIVASLFMGILLNFTMFLCTIVNSALTTTIVGVLKGVGTTTLGFFILGGVEVHALNVSGLLINSLGGMWYSYAKYTQRKQKSRSEPEKEPLLPTSVPPRPLVL